MEIVKIIKLKNVECLFKIVDEPCEWLFLPTTYYHSVLKTLFICTKSEFSLNIEMHSKHIFLF